MQSPAEGGGDVVRIGRPTKQWAGGRAEPLGLPVRESDGHAYRASPAVSQGGTDQEPPKAFNERSMDGWNGPGRGASCSIQRTSCSPQGSIRLDEQLHEALSGMSLRGHLHDDAYQHGERPPLFPGRNVDWVEILMKAGGRPHLRCTDYLRIPYLTPWACAILRRFKTSITRDWPSSARHYMTFIPSSLLGSACAAHGFVWGVHRTWPKPLQPPS